MLWQLIAQQMVQLFEAVSQSSLQSYSCMVSFSKEIFNGVVLAKAVHVNRKQGQKVPVQKNPQA